MDGRDIATGKADAGLWARAREWLDEAPVEHRSWCHAWKELWSANRQAKDVRAALFSIAVARMQIESFKNPSWPIVWTVLWDGSDVEKDILLRIADRLLVAAPPKDPIPVRCRIPK